jgi:hypothetical protein
MQKFKIPQHRRYPKEMENHILSNQETTKPQRCTKGEEEKNKITGKKKNDMSMFLFINNSLQCKQIKFTN